MKRSVLLVIALFLLCPIAANAQDAMPTKEETINYLQKRLKEADERHETALGYKFKYMALSISLMKDGNVELVYWAVSSGLCNSEYGLKFSHRFDPGDIVKVDLPESPSAKSDDPVRNLRLQFKAKTARVRVEHNKGPRCDKRITLEGLVPEQWNDWDTVDFPFFATSPENQGRITRAILHLRDLAKAEEDPFSK